MDYPAEDQWRLISSQEKLQILQTSEIKGQFGLDVMVLNITLFCLFLLMLYVPVNNFSVILS